MSQLILLRCPVCEQELVGVVDIPSIRQMQVSCPHCVDLAVSIMLQRTQPDNPCGEPVIGDREHWRMVGVAAGQHTPTVCTHRRQSRRAARRRHRRGR